MEELKPETIKIVTPNPTNFRYSYLVTPDEYKGVRKYKAECLIKKGTMMKDERGKEVDAVEHIFGQLEGLLERWKVALKEHYPDRKFSLTKNKHGEPSLPYFLEDDYLVIRTSKKAGGVKQNGDVWTNPPVTFWANEDPLRLMTEEEKKEYEKISPALEGQMSMKCSGYDAGANGVGIRCQPLQVIVRRHAEWTGSPDFEAETQPSYEEKRTASSAADF
tara:strand:+ start:5181 stop:5837 length:657 start_codon:yes stop_codon:yes gene_type:complete